MSENQLDEGQFMFPRRGREASGTGEMHAGWFVPGRSICIGVEGGPGVRIRLDPEEAAALAVELTELVNEEHNGWEFTPCGCGIPESEPPSADAAPQHNPFLED